MISAMRQVGEPRSGVGAQRFRVGLSVGLLLASAVALGVAPTLMPDSYSWVAHTTSESAAQGVDGAWLARGGFLLFGLGVLWISLGCSLIWRQPATALHVVFGGCMVSVAAFSLRSWETGARYDQVEDALHSVGATVMGFAFAFGVAAVGLRTRLDGGNFRALDGVAVAASVVLPIWMGVDGSVAGVAQRVMFLAAYLWYGREAVRQHR